MIESTLIWTLNTRLIKDQRHPTIGQNPSTDTIRSQPVIFARMKMKMLVSDPFHINGAGNKNFEVRVREVLQMKNSGASLNQRIIEAWINETLKDAEHLDIPGVILKPVHK